MRFKCFKNNVYQVIFVSILIQICLINQLSAHLLSEKSEKKVSQRWTLQEWLEQKNRNMLMDQWLMMNTPSPYEFILKYRSLNYTLKNQTGESQQGSLLGFAAYATFVGLEFQYKEIPKTNLIDKNFIIHMRLFGSSDQSTHFTLSLGEKQRSDSSIVGPIRHQYFGAGDLTIYFNQKFGIQFQYGQFAPLKADPQFGDLKGSYNEANLFLEFEALRLYGGIYKESEQQTLNNVYSESIVEGTHIGASLYF